MDNLFLKRKEFLEKLEEANKKLAFFNSISGRNFFKRMLRVLLFPHFYIFKLPIIKNFFKIKKTQLFYGKEIKTLYVDNNLPFFFIAGILPGKAEYKLTKFFIKNLKENDIFYDIGANYGFYTYLALEFCKEVHSFEPLPYVFENLEFNLKDVKNVYLNNVALSNKKGKTKIFLPEGSSFDTTEGSTIVEETKDKHSYKFFNELEIKTITLDEYLKTHNKPTIIKMDVEGAEKLVIEGGLNFFKKEKPLITLEVWSPEEGGEISMKAIDFLRSLGYNSYFINKNGDLEKVDGDLSLIVKKEGLFDDNFVFLKK